ncbi:MAG: hypothetical protein RL701_5541 [Pseudomonadota bacterium]
MREKWTLVPSFDLATGTTLTDLYVLLGLTEYNVLGTGSKLELSVYRERRGFGFYTSFQEHVYRRDRWALAGWAGYETSELRFADNEGWFSATALVYLWTTSPAIVSDHLRYEVGTFYKRESIADVTGSVHAPSGHVIGGSMLLTWDDYQWSDLTPNGWRASLTLSPGFFFGPALPESRQRAELSAKGAIRLTRDTGFMVRVEAGVGTRGNANHSLLVGSVSGVRGLEDSLYFNWLQSYSNLELRHAVRFAERWALQGVLFADAGAFEGITATGARGSTRVAFSGGLELRLVPTWLSGLILRFDVAHLFTPRSTLFYQYGLSQYF